MNFEGSSEKRQIRSFLATFGIDYDKLSTEQFVSLIEILKLSKYLKSPISQRGKRPRPTARENGRSAETTAALRRDGGFYIPLLPFPDSRILLLKNPAFVPQPASQNPPVLLPLKSVCQPLSVRTADGEASLFPVSAGSKGITH